MISRVHLMRLKEIHEFTKIVIEAALAVGGRAAMK